MRMEKREEFPEVSLVPECPRHQQVVQQCQEGNYHLRTTQSRKKSALVVPGEEEQYTYSIYIYVRIYIIYKYIYMNFYLKLSLDHMMMPTSP